jgi:hypothetical protein
MLARYMGCTTTASGLSARPSRPHTCSGSVSLLCMRAASGASEIVKHFTHISSASACRARASWLWWLGSACHLLAALRVRGIRGLDGVPAILKRDIDRETVWSVQGSSRQQEMKGTSRALSFGPHSCCHGRKNPRSKDRKQVWTAKQSENAVQAPAAADAEDLQAKVDMHVLSSYASSDRHVASVSTRESLCAD